MPELHPHHHHRPLRQRRSGHRPAGRHGGVRPGGAAGRDLSGLADEGGQVLRLGTGGEDLGKIPRSHPLRLSPLPHLRRLHPAAHDL